MIKTSGIVVCALLGLTSFALPACSGSNGGGTPSKADQCKQLYAAICKKTYECTTAEDRATVGDAYGTNETDCPAALAKASPDTCNAVTTCDPGTTYQSAEATKCISAVGTITCAMYASGDPPAECNNVC